VFVLDADIPGMDAPGGEAPERGSANFPRAIDASARGAGAATPEVAPAAGVLAVSGAPTPTAAVLVVEPAARAGAERRAFVRIATVGAAAIAALTDGLESPGALPPVRSPSLLGLGPARIRVG
jgi:hypothetical protein